MLGKTALENKKKHGVPFKIYNVPQVGNHCPNSHIENLGTFNNKTIIMFLSIFYILSFSSQYKQIK